MNSELPKIWTRETTWRQGQILPQHVAEELKLSNRTDAKNTCVVVVSHDCDVANDNLTNEPDIEVIVGRTVKSFSGNLLYGKNPRVLHFFALKTGSEVVVELIATDKVLVSKINLLNCANDPNFTVEPENLRVLGRWLASRYRRSAFANEFETRMATTKLKDRIAKLVDPVKCLSSVYFEVDEGKEIDRKDGSPYLLKIFLSFKPGQDPDASSNAIQKLSVDLYSLFESTCYDHHQDTWSHFHLAVCEPASEDDMTITAANFLMSWRLDHLSLKEGLDSTMPFDPNG